MIGSAVKFLPVVLALACASQASADEPNHLLLTDVRILHLDKDGSRIEPDMAILIEDGLISEVYPNADIPPPDNVVRINANGRLAMPGMTDMHVHVWDEASLGAYLASGVTTIRNASGMPMHLRLADRIERGELTAPRLITSGPILNSPGANAQINHEIVTSADEARAAVKRHHEAGFERIKTYSNLTRDAYDGVLAEARKLGMTVMGHTPEGVRQPGMPRDLPFEIDFVEILDDDFETIEHVESIVWHGLRDRHDEIAGRKLARQIADAGLAVDPTLLAFYNLLQVAETQGAYLDRPGTELLNPLLVQQSQAQYRRWSGEDVVRNRAAFEFYKRMTRMLFEEGVVLVAGSDAGIFTNVPGISLLEELELLHEAGIDPASVLRMATINAAEVLKHENAGRIAKGYRADLILLESDPTQNLKALGNISAVVANGRFLDREALANLTEKAAQHDPERTQRNLVEALRAQGVDPGTIGF